MVSGTEKNEILFYLILINLNLISNSQTWLLVAVLDNTGLM